MTASLLNNAITNNVQKQNIGNPFGWCRLAFGCTKEEKPSGIQIHEENMGGNAKVCADVDNLLQNRWDVFEENQLFQDESVRLTFRKK